MEIEQHIIGFTSEGEVILRYTLANSCGMVVTLLNYGATVESIVSPSGEPLTITYPSYKDYMSDSLMMGKIVGRCAGRIAKGVVEIDNEKYRLTTNERTTHLNGGISGFSSKLWQSRSEEDMVVFSYLSPASEEGYPAEMGVEVGYTLTDNNELSIVIMAESDATTIANIAPFIYLSFGDDSQLTIKGNKVIELDKRDIPTGEVIDTKDSVYNFAEYKPIDCEMEGYWITALECNDIIKEHASLRSADEKKSVTIASTQPMLYVSGCGAIEGCGFNANGNELTNGEATLLVPMNVPFDTTDRLIIKEGERYHHQTVYAFTFSD